MPGTVFQEQANDFFVIDYRCQVERSLPLGIAFTEVATIGKQHFDDVDVAILNCRVERSVHGKKD